MAASKQTIMAKQLQRRCHVPLQNQMSILLVLKVSNEMALGQLERNYFRRFGEGILLLQVNSGACCQVHQLQPAPSVGPGKICSRSSSAAAAAPGRTEPLGQEWLGQERVIWHHSFGFYLGKDPLKNPSLKLYQCQNPTKQIRAKSKAC